jgi:deazaflavin-dependent oxidoreductase (nitroreductase family)
MALPKWLARINRRVFNPIEIKRGKRPVLAHVGRTSGNTYHTPLDAHPVEGGFVFIPNYGADSDWVRNIMAAGSAGLRIGEVEQRLVSPRMIDVDEANAILPEKTQSLIRRLGLTGFLRMDVAG